MKSICVFCGSGSGHDPEIREVTREIGREFAKNNVTLVYGGASVGLMGILADSCLREGGKVIGVIPEFLVHKELGHDTLTELYIVKSMHERKKKMYDLSNGFLALPGGIGTLDELFEILTWLQLGLHSKPCAILNVNHFYDHLIAFLDHTVDQGFLKPSRKELLSVANNVSEVFSNLNL